MTHTCEVSSYFGDQYLSWQLVIDASDHVDNVARDGEYMDTRCVSYRKRHLAVERLEIRVPHELIHPRRRDLQVLQSGHVGQLDIVWDAIPVGEEEINVLEDVFGVVLVGIVVDRLEHVGEALLLFGTECAGHGNGFDCVCGGHCTD